MRRQSLVQEHKIPGRVWLKRGLCLAMIIVCLLLSGCGSHELENNAFPLALGIGKEDGEFHMYAAYPNLQNLETPGDALASDLYWEGTMDDLLEGTALMSRESSRNVNLNHLKVLILDRTILDGQEEKEQLVEFFREKRDAAWNSYVLLCDGDMGTIFSDEMDLNSCLGIYLEDLAEGWTNLKSGTLITVGDLMSQYYNADEILLVPIVTTEEKRPVVKEFAVVENLQYVSERSMEEVFANYTELKFLTDGKGAE